MPLLVNVDVALVNIRKGEEERSIAKIAIYKMRQDRAHNVASLPHCRELLLAYFVW